MALALRAAYHGYPTNAQTGVVVVAGDLIIVGYSYNEITRTSTCTDNATGGSNTYNRIAGTEFTGASTAFAEAFYAIAKASETLTITCTARVDNGISVHVVSGNNQTLASVLDVSNTSSDAAGTAHTSASVVTTNADDYLFVLWYQEDTASSHTENGTSFVIRTEEQGHAHATFDRIVSSTGTYQDTITTSANVKYGNIIAAFKAAAGAATTLMSQICL